MYDPKDIERIHGGDALDYARNKNRGGRSSAKGRDFEILYGAYRIALEAKAVIALDELGDSVVMADQVLCFIDDFIVEKPGETNLGQLKSGVATWGKGDRCVANDFRLQKALDEALERTASYRLVVGEAGTADKLVAGRPDDLSEVEVCVFPEGQSDRELIAALPDLASALDALTIRSPEPIVREQAFRLLLAAWLLSKGPQRLDALVNSAAEGPNGIIAPMLPPYEVADNLREALDAIPDFLYAIDRNVFHYTSGRMNGYASFHCHTPQFAAFAAALVNSPPRDFEDFFVVMRTYL